MNEYSEAQGVRKRALLDALHIVKECHATPTTTANVLILARFILDGDEKENP